MFCGCAVTKGDAAQHAHLPGVPGASRRAAGRQPARRGVRRAHRPGAQLHRAAAQRLPPQELLLSRPAQGVPDQPVRRAAGRERLVRLLGRRREAHAAASTACTWRRTPPSWCTPAASRAASPAPSTRWSTSTAAARRWWRSSASPTSRRPAAAREFLQQLRNLVIELGVSECNMEEGQVRWDANISVRPAGSHRAGHAHRAQEHEQLPLPAAGAGGRDTASDRDPRGRRHASIRRRCTSTPTRAPPRRCAPRRRRTTTATSPSPTWCRWYVDAGLGRGGCAPRCRSCRRRASSASWPSTASRATTPSCWAASAPLARFYEEVAAQGADAKLAANWTMGEYLAHLNAAGLEPGQGHVTPSAWRRWCALVADGTISGSAAKEVFRAHGRGARRAGRHGRRSTAWGRSRDEGALEAVVAEVVADNPAQVEQYRGGKQQVLGFFVGQVMKATQRARQPASWSTSWCARRWRRAAAATQRPGRRRAQRLRPRNLSSIARLWDTESPAHARGPMTMTSDLSSFVIDELRSRRARRAHRRHHAARRRADGRRRLLQPREGPHRQAARRGRRAPDRGRHPGHGRRREGDDQADRRPGPAHVASWPGTGPCIDDIQHSHRLRRRRRGHLHVGQRHPHRAQAAEVAPVGARPDQDLRRLRQAARPVRLASTPRTPRAPTSSSCVRFGQAAKEEGADRLRFCDTLGILDPFDTYNVISVPQEATAASTSRCTRTTTSAWRRPTRWPASRPAPPTSTRPSTASASAPATPPSKRSSWRSSTSARSTWACTRAASASSPSTWRRPRRAPSRPGSRIVGTNVFAHESRHPRRRRHQEPAQLRGLRARGRGPGAPDRGRQALRLAHHLPQVPGVRHRAEQGGLRGRCSTMVRSTAVELKRALFDKELMYIYQDYIAHLGDDVPGTGDCGRRRRRTS